MRGSPRFNVVSTKGGQTLYEAIVDAAGGGDYKLLSTALSSGARSIFVRNGTYVETADIDLPASDITIVGENKEKAIIDFDTNRQLDMASRNDCVIKRLTIKGGNSSGVLRVRGARNIISDCFFEANNIDIQIEGVLNMIHNCQMSNPTNDGIKITSNGDWNMISQCHFNNSRLVISSGSNFNTVTGCIFYDNSSSTVAGDGNSLVGNIWGSDQDGRRGALIISGNRNLLIGNVFSRGAVSVNAVTITGNNNTVSNNNIEGATAAYDDNISLSSTANNNIISNNYIAGAAAYGVHIESSNETNNIITGNQFASNTTADILDVGTGTIINNNYPDNVTSKTGDYTATGLDSEILCNASSAGFTITLPAAANIEGKIYHIKKTDSSGNTVTVDGNASETIDGATTAVITNQYESIMILCDGSNWHII